MKRELTEAGLVSGMCLVLSLGFVGCADEQPNNSDATAPTGQADVTDSDEPTFGEFELKMEGDWKCEIQDGEVFASRLDGSEEVYCGPMPTPCNKAIGCEPYDGLATSQNALTAVAEQAIELDEGACLMANASGDCTPAGSFQQGHVTERNGTPYLGRWLCNATMISLPNQPVQCILKAVKFDCLPGQTIVTGAYPNYALCITPVQCTDNNDPRVNDNIQCTVDTCVNNVVVHTPMVSLPAGQNVCNDGNACTVNDACNAFNSCVGVAKVCDDSNACTTDTCTVGTGVCVNSPLPNSTSCDDGLFCTVGETCQQTVVGGVVTSACTGTPRVCADLNSCTGDRCDEATDSCAFVPAVPGSACTLADKCEVNATCGFNNVCGGDPKDCADQNACTVDVCVPATGDCQNTAAVDGTTCNNAVTGSPTDRCIIGTCQARWCDTLGGHQCEQIAGPPTTQAWDTCIQVPGSQLGLWTAVVNCGTLDAGQCVADVGCSSITPTEANCTDGLDNDGDGARDCADADCGANVACNPMVACSAVNPCPTGQGCCAGGMCAAACNVTPPAVCVDADSDGYDNCAIGVVGGDNNLADCNDLNANVRPGAAELCNGLDDNCTGQIDEGCAVPVNLLGFSATTAGTGECWGTAPANYLGSITFVIGTRVNCPAGALALTMTTGQQGSCYWDGLVVAPPHNLIPGPGFGCQAQ